MKKVFLTFIVNGISLYLVSLLMSSINISSFSSLIILTIIFVLLNLTIKPLLQFFSLPITFLTLGFFALIVNAVVLELSFRIVPGTTINGFISAIGASIILSIANAIIYSVID